MRTIAVSGASGLIGSALCAALESQGHEVRPLRRASSGSTRFDLSPLAGTDAVVHLAGENIAQRWTAARRERIVASRVEGTEEVARAVAALQSPPRVFLSASAIGFYGDRPAPGLDEGASRGEGFLARTTEAWELAAAPAR